MADLTIPFIMLLALTIGLLFERKQHEDKIVDIYEDKLEEWKKHAEVNPKEKKCKELVGLVFLEDEKLNIEVLETKVLNRLERKKFTIEVSHSNE